MARGFFCSHTSLSFRESQSRREEWNCAVRMEVIRIYPVHLVRQATSIKWTAEKFPARPERRRGSVSKVTDRVFGLSCQAGISSSSWHPAMNFIHCVSLIEFVTGDGSLAGEREKTQTKGIKSLLDIVSMKMKQETRAEGIRNGDWKYGNPLNIYDQFNNINIHPHQM